MRDSFIQRLTEMAARDPRVMLITGDLGFGVLDDYRRRFPKQFLNAGVAEQNMTGLAVGLALEGFIVYTYSIANFVFMRCLEQIRNDAAYHAANVNVVAIGGGFSYGALGISHHATEDLAIMRSLPEMTVVAPADDWEAAEATEAVAATRGCCYLRLDRAGAARRGTPQQEFALGRARRVREGRTVTLVSTGGILGEVTAAADMLARQGWPARVLSMHTIKPLDRESLYAAARETGGVMTIEEHVTDGGLGSAVAEVLLESSVRPVFFHRLGLSQGFSSIVGNQNYLRARYGIDAASIAAKAVELLRGGLRVEAA